MNYLQRGIGSLLLILCMSISFATSAAVDTVKKVTKEWGDALSSNDPKKITALYDKDALLYATFSNLIDSQSGMVKYFTKLMQHKDLKVTFIKENVRLYGDDVAINSGLYEFSYTEKGKTVKVPGRYTFVYHETPRGWLIIDHHSSVMPEQ